MEPAKEWTILAGVRDTWATRLDGCYIQDAERLSAALGWLTPPRKWRSRTANAHVMMLAPSPPPPPLPPPLPSPPPLPPLSSRKFEAPKGGVDLDGFAGGVVGVV